MDALTVGALPRCNKNRNHICVFQLAAAGIDAGQQLGRVTDQSHLSQRTPRALPGYRAAVTRSRYGVVHGVVLTHPALLGPASRTSGTNTRTLFGPHTSAAHLLDPR